MNPLTGTGAGGHKYKDQTEDQREGHGLGCLEDAENDLRAPSAKLAGLTAVQEGLVPVPSGTELNHARGLVITCLRTPVHSNLSSASSLYSPSAPSLCTSLPPCSPIHLLNPFSDLFPWERPAKFSYAWQGKTQTASQTYIHAEEFHLLTHNTMTSVTSKRAIWWYIPQ
jgi:hypothetical protein